MSYKEKDYYFQKAKDQNYFARSAFKLDEIEKKFKILKKNGTILDCGYYPGSWIQFTSRWSGGKAKIFGLDIQPINKSLVLPNVTLFKADFLDTKNVLELCGVPSFDVVLSDMAPKTSGIKSVDQQRSYELVEKLIAILPQILAGGGNFVAKVFDGPDAQGLIKELKKNFKLVKQFRPKSTRSISKEFFVISKEFVA